MAILSTGNTYVTNDQVTAANLNSAVNGATFASGAVDNSTTQISTGGPTAGSIIVRDKGITAAKLESGSNGQLFIGNGTGFTKATLTAGSNVTITNGAGSITIASTASGGGGTISGTVGVVDNALVRADGTGGYTVQYSPMICTDAGVLTGLTTVDTLTEFKVNGTKVVGIQAAPISNFTATTVFGTGDDGAINSNFSDLQTKFNDLLAKLRTHGLIQT